MLIKGFRELEEKASLSPFVFWEPTPPVRGQVLLI